MIELYPPRIVCAACQHPDGRIVTGPRHFDYTMWQQILNMSPEQFAAQMHSNGPPAALKDWHFAEQGFIDQHGKFYTREEAWPIAHDNGQIRRDHDWQTGSLHSEHLY